MTVKELIEKLQSFPQDLEIYSASDGEGNSFRPVRYPEKANCYKRRYGIDIIADEDIDEYPPSEVTPIICL